MFLHRKISPAWSLPTLRAIVVAACVLLITVPASQAAPRHRASHRGNVAATVVPRALRSAASLSVRADHVLVTDARALNVCLRKNGPHSASCAAKRGAVQRAGRTLARARRHLALVARSSTRARKASNAGPRRAPLLSVSGNRLTWTKVEQITSYVLVRRISGRANVYSIVHGTSTTPPPAPGVTVSYSVRTAVNGSIWSGWRQVSYPSPVISPQPPAPGGSEEAPAPSSEPPSEAINFRAAPVITVSGQTLSWNTVAGVATYVLVSKVPGQAESFSVVNGTSTTPTPVAGKTVDYSVRTAVNGSEWATEVAISYPAAPPAPKEEPPASAVFQPGIDAGWNLPEEPNAAASIGAKVARVEFTFGAAAPEIEKFIRSYAEKGIRVEPLAGFQGTLPSSAEARNLASWATAYGPGGTFWAHRSDGYLAIQTIEFGNETSAGWQYGDAPGDASYTARARTYAIRLKEAAEAINATGEHVGLLAVGEDPSGEWMNGMFAAVPNLGSYVGGWVAHLYGPSWHAKLEALIGQSAAHGASSTIPIDVTEWGLSGENTTCVTEDYGWNPCMNYQETGETLHRTVGEIRHVLGSRMGLFIFYQLRDQRPVNVSQSPFYYFGVLQNNLQPKGHYTTAAEEVLAE